MAGTLEDTSRTSASTATKWSVPHTKPEAAEQSSRSGMFLTALHGEAFADGKAASPGIAASPLRTASRTSLGASLRRGMQERRLGSSQSATALRMSLESPVKNGSSSATRNEDLQSPGVGTSLLKLASATGSQRWRNPAQPAGSSRGSTRGRGASSAQRRGVDST